MLLLTDLIKKNLQDYRLYARLKTIAWQTGVRQSLQ